MRLIDADALKEKIEAESVSGTIAGYFRFVLVDCLDEDAPTIDAIPVEWLKQRRDEAYKAVYYCGGNVERNAEIMSAIRTVLELWEKEQEEETMNIKEISTRDLVEELKLREGVETREVAPHEPFEIKGVGPAVVLVVID